MIATYYHPVVSINESEQRQVLNLFLSAWRDSRQFGMSLAELHPRFLELEALISAYPEVTPPGYRDQCFFRWLAFDQMQHQGPLLLLDYDVFSVQDLPMQWFLDRYKHPTVLNQTNPCAVFLPDAGFLRNIVDMLFLPTAPNQEPSGPHIGDNTVFCKHWRAIGDCDDIVSTYPDTHTGLVHFANRFCPRNKAKIIRETMRSLHAK